MVGSTGGGKGFTKGSRAEKAAGTGTGALGGGREGRHVAPEGEEKRAG